jgi:hypothetical protein
MPRKARCLKGMTISNILIPNDMERTDFIMEGGAETEFVVEPFAVRNSG